MNNEPHINEAFWLHAIIEGSGVGTWLWNVQTGETVFNQRWAEIIGYTLAEISPVNIETWLQFAHPDDLERSAELLEQHFQGQTPFYHCEARMRHKTGHWVWVRDHGKVVSRTEDGKPEWMAGSHLDITEEKERKLSLLRLDKISKTMPGVIFEYNQAANGSSTFPYASAAIEDIYGVKPDQVQSNANVVFAAIHPDDLEHVKASIEASRKTLCPWKCEYRVTHNNMEKWVTGHALPESNEDGSISWFGQIFDTTTARQIKAELEESKANLEIAQQIGQLGYWKANMETGALFWSDMIYQIFGVDKDSFIPSVEAFSQFVHPDDINLVRDSEKRAERTGIHDVVHRIILPNGDIRWVHELADFSKQKGQKYLIGTVRDITKQKLYELELQHSSITDPLTNAFNRRYFNQRLEQVFPFVVERQKSVCLGLIDIDHFKRVNDTYGHSVGDDVLKSLTALCMLELRSVDVFARFGGEEFVVLLEDCQPEQALLRLNKLRQAIEQRLFVCQDIEINITVTIGIAHILPTDESPQASLKRADIALYKGKSNGRNQSRID